MRKNDVTFRRGYSRNNAYAAVNIKVPYQALDSAIREAREDEELPVGLTEEWIRENISEERLDAIFWHVCAAEYEYFIDYAAEIMPGTTFQQDGRSGGWAVSNHSDYDVEGWDAVQVAKWGKIERVAREIASGVNAQLIYSIHLNEYEPYAEAIYVDAAPVGETIAAV